MTTEVVLNDSKEFILNNIKLQLYNNKKNLTSSILFLSGPPGSGKSSLLEQVAKEFNYSLNVKYMSTMLLEQISGLPIPPNPKYPNESYQWSKSELISENNLKIQSSDPDAPIILFLDDSHLCGKSIQSYMFQLLTYKSIHEHKLKNNVVIILAGNSSLDRAGAQPILSPIVNRIFFINIKTTAEDWIQNFAINYGVRQDILSFIDLYPDLLSSPPLESIAFASPRSWTYYSDSLSQLEKEKKLTTNDYLILGQGHIGQEYTSKFVEYVQLFSKWNAKSFFTGTPLPDLTTLSKIENYTLMSSVISELMKSLRNNNFDIKVPIISSNIEITQKLFNGLVISCKEIIPLGLRTIIVSENMKSKQATIFYKLIQNNPQLLEAAKKILNVKNS